MNSKVFDIIDACENRYLSPREETEILSYVNEMPARIVAMKDLQGKEAEVCEAVVLRLQAEYRTVANYHQDQWAKAYRDCQLTLRVMAQAMLLGDVQYLEDKLLYWFRSILVSFDYTPQIIRDCFLYLEEEVKACVEADTYGLMQTYLARTTQVLSDFPEPANPRV